MAACNHYVVKQLWKLCLYKLLTSCQHGCQMYSCQAGIADDCGEDCQRHTFQCLTQDSTFWVQQQIPSLTFPHLGAVKVKGW